MKRLVFLCLASAALSSTGALAGDGVVALHTADPSCPDHSGNRYVDCGNGTVTDNDTGLVWLADADCLGQEVDWYTATEFAAGLSDKPTTSAAADHDCGLMDGSSPGEWRLPSIEEWEAMVADAAALGCDPTITNDSGAGCWLICVIGIPPGQCSFSGVQSTLYWSSSHFATDPSRVWQMRNYSGVIDIATKDSGLRVWLVRDGQ